MFGSFQQIDRDSAFLIPGKVEGPEWTEVDVQLGEDVTLEDINTPDVILLMSKDCKTIRFERATSDQRDEKYANWEAADWMVIGFEMVDYCKDLEEYNTQING